VAGVLELEEYRREAHSMHTGFESVAKIYEWPRE